MVLIIYDKCRRMTPSFCFLVRLFVVVELIDTIVSELIPLHMLLSYFLIMIEYPFSLDIYRPAHTQGILNNKTNLWFLDILLHGASNPQVTTKGSTISFTPPKLKMFLLISDKE